MGLVPLGVGRFGGVALEVDEEASDVGGGDAFEAGGLADGGGAEEIEAVAGFGAQGAEVEICQVGRDPVVFHGGGAADLGFLLTDVAGVLDFELDVRGGLGRGRRIAGEVGDEVAGDAGAGEEFEAAGGLAERGEFEIARRSLIDGVAGMRRRCSQARVASDRSR